jgi:hypothetical protein
MPGRRAHRNNDAFVMANEVWQLGVPVRIGHGRRTLDALHREMQHSRTDRGYLREGTSPRRAKRKAWA